MKKLNDEIKLTIEMMQGDIDEGAHNELQYHLMSLLEIKRELLSERVHTYAPAQIKGWPADAEERIDGEHYWRTNHGVAPDLAPDTIIMIECRKGVREHGEVGEYEWGLKAGDYDIIRWRLA